MPIERILSLLFKFILIEEGLPQTYALIYAISLIYPSFSSSPPPYLYRQARIHFQHVFGGFCGGLLSLHSQGISSSNHTSHASSHHTSHASFDYVEYIPLLYHALSKAEI